ncbi:TPA: hypothetical protein MD880_001562 [Escherichia coli]|nr:hypothetical protein [Escherichia coli]
MINAPSFTKYENLAISMDAILHDFPSKPCFPYSEQEFDCDPEDHDSDNYLRPSDYNSFIHTPEFSKAVTELENILSALAKDAILAHSDELSLHFLAKSTSAANKAIEGVFDALRYLLRTTS